jgi:threonine/homoserine/homoserine lactone efflux protein
VGVATGFGLAVGDLVHTLMATLGLSAVLMTSSLAFDIVKYVGAAYLIYLGIRALLERSDLLTLPTLRVLTPARAFRQAILAEILNPKTALFFLAFLPQFVHPENGAVVIQFAIFGLIFVVMSAVYASVLGALAGGAGRFLARHRGIGRWQGKVVGVIFLALGLRLAAQQR